MSGPATIGIDAGTTNVKVVLLDGDRSLVASARRPLSTRIDGDVAEQDAEAVWAAVRDSIVDVTAAAPGVAAQVAAVGCCSQYSSIVAVDSAGDPLAPMVMWSDLRGTDHSFELLAEHEDSFELWIEHHGIPPVGDGLALAHILHLQKDRPEIHAATATWLESMDFINLRLTGVTAANQGTMFMSQLCDNRTLGTSRYDSELVARSGVDADRLPPLLATDEPVGSLLPALARDLCLPQDVVVYGATNDTVAAAIATGALGAGRAGLSIGTTSVLIDTLDHKDTDIEHELLTMPSPFEDTWVLWAENGMGGRALEHLLVEVVHAVDALADHTTDDEFAQLDAALASVGPGSNGLLFLPWLNGSFSPSRSSGMRGGFINMSLGNKRADLVRAVTEGIAHNLAWLLPAAEEFTGKRMEEIAFLGGAARSTVWCQVLADVLDRPIAAVADADWAVARGAAALASYHHGAIDRSTLEEGIDIDARYEPDPANRATYDLMQEQFVAAFHALRPIHESLNQ